MSKIDESRNEWSLQWVPVSERLPEKPGSYLVHYPLGQVHEGIFRDLRYHRKPEMCAKWDVNPWGTTDSVLAWAVKPPAPHVPVEVASPEVRREA